LQVTVIFTAGEEGKKERSRTRSTLSPVFACGGAPPVAVARGGDAPPLFLRPETFLGAVPACRRASL